MIFRMHSTIRKECDCPFGSHVRRANPRDSLQPDDPAQQSIVNRHRLLRRGRAYEYRTRDVTRDGARRVCCSLHSVRDLERQFEFVQQTWLNSPVFHGLKDKPDPIVAAQNPHDTKIYDPDAVRSRDACTTCKASLASSREDTSSCRAVRLSVISPISTRANGLATARPTLAHGRLNTASTAS